MDTTLFKLTKSKVSSAKTNHILLSVASVIRMTNQAYQTVKNQNMITIDILNNKELGKIDKLQLRVYVTCL